MPLSVRQMFCIALIMASFGQAPVIASADTLGDSIDIALHRAVYQSSAVDYDNTAQLTTDGSNATHWAASSAAPQWMYVDLGQVCVVKKITLVWDSGYAPVYSIQSSVDQQKPDSWTTVYSTINGSGGLEQIVTPPFSAHYVRLTLPANPTVHNYLLDEFEIFGDRPAAGAARVVPRMMEDGSYALTGGNWKVQPATSVTQSPEEISTLSFDDKAWLPATVPGTVLTSYYDDGAIPDPLFGNQITEISNSFFTDNDFWYRNTFTVPASYTGKRVWLNFDGINWKADIYINGQPLGQINGAFIRGKFDITQYVTPGSVCALAVLVHKNANPGPVKPKTLAYMPHNGGVLGLDSPTFVASQGWNWIPPIPGREYGLWNKVFLSSTGAVSIDDPFVTTALPLPALDHADVDVSAAIVNHSDQPVSGIFEGSIGTTGFSQPVQLAGHETRSVEFEKSRFPQLIFSRPKLWWPNGMGDQNLYRLSLKFVQNGMTSDSKSVTFGIRQFSYKLVKSNPADDGVLWFYVNGKRILVRGGNWGMDEAMLRYDAPQYDTAVRLHKEMNDNIIRVWIGMVGKDAFFDACDKYGILVWNDFWLANPGDGPSATDTTMFLANAVDRIKVLRNHACLLLYCGRNEGYPPAELNASLHQAVDQLDGSRYYIGSSWDPPVSGGGPYMLKTPAWYFENQGQRLHSELGIVSAPTVDSIKQMFAAEDQWPIDDVWGLHDFCNDGYSNRAKLYINEINAEYGTAANLEDFCRKAQMVNMETSKAEAEANQSAQGSGMMIWLSHPAWPSLTCQTYDYYFEPTASYYGTKSGNEPIHILWNSATDEVEVANDTVDDTGELTAEADVYDFTGNRVWSDTAAVDVASAACSNCFPLQQPPSLSGVYFIKLRLYRTALANDLSSNFYWASTQPQQYVQLNDLPIANLTVATLWPRALFDKRSGVPEPIAVHLTNSASVALEVHLELVNAKTGKRVLPTFFSDNYFSLLPNESKDVTVTINNLSLAEIQLPSNLKLAITGWNISPQTTPPHEF